MANQPLLSVEDILNALIYNPETGEFRWRKRALDHFKSRQGMAVWNSKYPGQIAGCLDSNGYIKIKLFDRGYLAHRLAWYLTYGEWGECIDHINSDRADNRISNLRSVNHSINQKNQKMHSTNTSGHTGVSQVKGGRWVARIKVDGKQIHLGSFWTMEDAVKCRVAANKKYGFLDKQ